MSSAIKILTYVTAMLLAVLAVVLVTSPAHAVHGDRMAVVVDATPSPGDLGGCC